ncbi:MAG: hypothetical protein KGN84_18425 [Acidobacteriota bacterium]|nr:hypothetical protein [Acidobacteriota bacterium]
MTSCRFLSGILLAALASAAEPPGPVKLSLKTERHSVAAGEKLNLSIELLDSANQPAKATMPLPIQIQERTAPKEVRQLQTVTIPAMQSSVSATVVLQGDGIEYLWAKNPQLNVGGVYIRVHPVRLTPVEAAPAPPPPSAAAAAEAAPVVRLDRRPAALAPEPAPVPHVTLRFSPDRVFLADGKDAANVEAFLLSPDTYPRDIRLSLFGSSSDSNPLPLRIAAGQSSARVALTSGQAGNVMAEYLSSDPDIALDGDKTLNIHFGPPITHLRLSSSPPSISLVDTATIFATLVNDGGIAQNTDVNRSVAFSIASGKGTVDNQVIQIPAGQSSGKITFHPEWRGQVTVSAATANLMDAQTPVAVTIPVALLLCSALGGLMGSLLPQRGEKAGRKKKFRTWRPIVGMITGFILYWFCIFVGLGAVRHDVALNPMTAIAISALGGWLQTAVLEGIWKSVSGGAQTISSAAGSQ